uniref:Uncharacterized protein n=1 Tax=Bursaphelenchus xylophilus TaxID=6326 RepID=A0A1I7S2M9_BURXY
MDLAFVALFVFSLFNGLDAVIEYFSAIPIAPQTFFLIWKMSSDVYIHHPSAHFKIKSEIERDGESTRITETRPNILEVCKEHVGEHGVTICTYNSTSHRPGKKQTFKLEYYEKPASMLGTMEASGTSWFFPPSLRVVDNNEECIKLLLRTETNGKPPKRFNIEFKSNENNAEWIEAPESIEISKPQNLYSTEFCISTSSSDSASQATIKGTADYLFRFNAFCESTFTFMGKTYTIEEEYSGDGENLWSHVQRKNEPKIVFPIVTVHTKNGWFLNFSLPNITKKDDNEEPFRIDYKLDRYSRPFNWTAVPKRYLNDVTFVGHKVSINLTELVFRKRLPPDAEFRLFFRVRTANGWIWSQPSYSYKYSDKPSLAEFKMPDFAHSHMFFHRLVAVVMIFLIGASVAFVLKYMQKKEMLEMAGFSYRKLDSQQEGEFV